MNVTITVASWTRSPVLRRPGARFRPSQTVLPEGMRSFTFKSAVVLTIARNRFAVTLKRSIPSARPLGLLVSLPSR